MTSERRIPTRPRGAGVAIVALAVACLGCDEKIVVTQQVGEALVVANHWSSAVAISLPGLFLIAFGFGIKVFRPQHSRWGTRGIFAAGLLLAGTALSVEPFQRALVTSTSLQLRGGVLGRSVETIRLDELRGVTLREEVRRESVGRGTRYETVGIATWTLADGRQEETEYVPGWRSVAVERFLDHVRRAGVPIADQR